MASLTEIAYYSKKIIKVGFFVLIGLIVFRVLYSIGKEIWLQYHPAPPPAPNVAFGKLPQIVFPDKETTDTPDYILETPTGALPEFYPQIEVYLSPYQKPSLLAPEKAKEQAAKLGFTEEPKVVTEKVYRWSKSKPSGAVLEMDIFSGSFNFVYDWQSEKILLEKQSLPSGEQAVSEAKSFLKRIGVLEKDLEEGRTELAFLKASGTRVLIVPSLSEADFIQVDLFRQDIEETPILTPDPEKGVVSIIISGVQGANRRIVKAEYNYYPVNYNSSSTYPIKSSAAAWEELKNNQAYLASWEGQEKITIRRVYLAYFDSYEPQQYLQPIIVFQGDDNFYAYVPAVTEGWYKDAATGD